jgi:hypothetical protein
MPKVDRDAAPAMASIESLLNMSCLSLAVRNRRDVERALPVRL